MYNIKAEGDMPPENQIHSPFAKIQPSYDIILRLIPDALKLYVHIYM